MVVRVRKIDVKGMECVSLGCHGLGTGLRSGVVGECGCSLGSAGEKMR